MRELRDALGEVSRLVEFFRQSRVAQASRVPERHRRQLVPASPLSDAADSCCEPALRALLENWRAIRDALEEISSDAAGTVEAGSLAAGFGRAMATFDFWFGVCLAGLLFGMTSGVAKAVQSSTATVASNLRLVKQLREVVVAQRD